MKKKLSILALAAFCLLGLSGCMTVRNVTNTTNITGLNITSPNLKKGTDCSTYILGLIGPFGNTTIRDAAKDAKITKIAYVDYEDSYYLLYGQRCTIVYGF